MKKMLCTFLLLLAAASMAQAMTSNEYQACREAAQKLTQPDANMQATRCLMLAIMDVKKRNETYLASGPAEVSLQAGSGTWVDKTGYTNRVQHSHITHLFMPRHSDGLDYDVDFTSRGAQVKVTDGTHYLTFDFDLTTNQGRYLEAKIPLTLSSSENAAGTKVVVGQHELVKVLNKMYLMLPSGMSMSQFAARSIQDTQFRDALLEVGSKMLVTGQ